MNPSKFQNRYGKWACITGGAQGLGAAFAEQLAVLNVNLVLIDIQEEKLKQIANDFERKHEIETHAVGLDLSDKNAPNRILEDIQARDCRLVIFSASYGPVRSFVDNSPQQLDQFLNVNARTTLHLSHLCARHWINQSKPGGLVFISSLAGLWGTNLVAPYGATKAFDWNLGEALSYELKDHQIDSLSVCAGAMSTPHYLSTKPQYGRLKPKVDSPRYVARISLAALGKRTLLIPGSSNRLTYFLLMRLLPRKWATTLMNNTMKKMYPHVWDS